MSDLDDLERLHALRQRDVLSEEEYQSRKATVLKGRAPAAKSWLKAWVVIATLVALFSVVVVFLLLSGAMTVSRIDEPPSHASSTIDSGSRAPMPAAAMTPASPTRVAIQPEPEPSPTGTWPSYVDAGQAHLDRYTAHPFYGPKVFPDFHGKAREFVFFRSRIREGFLRGPNFDGSHRIIEIGCGMNCRFAYIGDERTGAVAQVVLDGDSGGEESRIDEMLYVPGSSLLFSAERDPADPTRCSYKTYNWTGHRFVRLSTKSITVASSEPDNPINCAM